MPEAGDEGWYRDGVTGMAILDREITGAFYSLSAEVEEVSARVRAGVVVVRAEGGGHGAGVVWEPDGVVVTNHHVASGDRAEVTLPTGRSYPAVVFRRDPRRDLAALRVDARGLPAVPVRDSRTLRPGELVLAVGNPLGVKGAVSVGIISGAVQEVQLGDHRFPEMVQADVDLYPGNSGGPLVDAGGRVVGINAMVTGPGIALAVPSQVAQRFLEGEPAGRAWFGIEVYGVELPPLLAEPLGISPESGLLVHSVEDGSPAEGAGVLLGDLLVALDGRILRGTEDLAWRLAGAEPGRPVRVTLLRGGKLLDLVATPTSRR